MIITEILVLLGNSPASSPGDCLDGHSVLGGGGQGVQGDGVPQVAHDDYLPPHDKLCSEYWDSMPLASS